MTTKELIALLRDDSNCNVLDYIEEAATRLEELEAENERLRKATVNSDDWVDD